MLYYIKSQVTAITKSKNLDLDQNAVLIWCAQLSHATSNVHHAVYISYMPGMRYTLLVYIYANDVADPIGPVNPSVSPSSEDKTMIEFGDFCAFVPSQ